MTKKRFLSIMLVLSLLLSICSVTATAVEPRASTTLLCYTAKVTQGTSAGEVEISYDVEANKRASQVGVSSIEIYKADDTYVTTITGTVDNDLIRENASRHRSSYIYTGQSGVYYYAVVTVTATIGSDTDSRDFTTSTVQAP